MDYLFLDPNELCPSCGKNITEHYILNPADEEGEQYIEFVPCVESIMDTVYFHQVYGDDE